MKFQEIDASTFEKFAKTQKKRSFEQTVEMANLRESRNFEVNYLALFHSEEIKVVALIYSQKVFGGSNMGIYYGPIYSEERYITHFLTELKKYAKRNNVLELVIFPYDDYQYYNNDGELIQNGITELINIYEKAGFNYQGDTSGFNSEQVTWHYVKDLTNITPENLLNSFSKKGRPLVKKSNTFGIKIRKLNRNELEIFADITTATATRRGYNDKGVEYYEKFYDAFKDKAEFTVATLNFSEYLNNIIEGRNKLEIKISSLARRLEQNPNSDKIKNQLGELNSQRDTFLVREEEAQSFVEKYGEKDVVLAGSLFVYIQQELVYLYSGSYVEFNKFYAPAVLQEYAMLNALNKGIKFYNMLGITGKFDNSDGVLGFKQNFNGYIVRKFSGFDYYPSPLKLKVIKSIKSLLRR
ncbi:aminoacyltransferase [Streptococcus iniae]|uniref:aminoacyltransferase n=1 Tax=Streptococcus iniae TaxID=1346 RepID=UPI0002E735F8|nr:aminoacyltransferase [Streptococcus iniae]ESR09033.1 peptidoglycan branched peptide synthesis protein [Streptococcus iniae IUSA1]KYJ82924.1 peptidoglycan branched peptide synthesis protein [Streptococcus iniae]RLV28620.1 aminoacyltransferase [Streptococcus iniae]RMI76808.1 aminoacyltransferase [Streptococcus iniae]HEK4517180.1 aminoacyltransferase [Streptococcus iniae]